MKDKDNGLTYTQVGDYLFPDLITTEEPITGKYARMRAKFLEEERPLEHLNLQTSAELSEHCNQIQKQAEERMEVLIQQMKEAEGVTEQLKAEDMMAWVGMMNTIRSAAEEIVLKEIVFA
ncbi:MAG: TnpV protein [Ruminococcus sp.]